MDLSWPMCEEAWDCLPLPRGFQSQEEDVFWKDWTWQHNKKEENRAFQSQKQREAWSGQGLDEQSQQQLGSNSGLSCSLHVSRRGPVACIHL